MTKKIPTRTKSVSLQQSMRVETPILGIPRDTKYSKIAKKGCFGLFLGKMALMYNTLFRFIHLNVFSGVLGIRKFEALRDESLQIASIRKCYCSGTIRNQEPDP